MRYQNDAPALLAPERSRVYESRRPCGRKLIPQVVWDQTDSRKDLLVINDLHDVDGGVVVVHAPPEGSGWLPSSILRAMGKDVDVSNSQDYYSADLALSWLRGEQIQHMVIYGAHRIREDLWKYIEFGPRLWLISPSQSACERFCSEYRASLKTSTRQAVNSLRREIESNRPEGNGPKHSLEESGEAARFPAVPFNDFTTFLAACHDTIRDPLDASLVQNSFVAGRNLVWDAMKQADHDIASRILVTRLSEALTKTSSQNEAICIYRGMQVGFFWTGHTLEGDLRDVLAAVSIDRRTSTDSSLREAIHRQTAFLPASAAVLAHTTSLTDAEIANLKKRCLKRDCSSVTFDGIKWEIPSPLRSPLRILSNSWTRSTEDEDDLLFKHYVQLQQPVEIKRAIWRFQQTSGVRIRASKTEHSKPVKGRRSLLSKHLRIGKLGDA